MTDNEIIEAIECCIIETECEKCPMYDDDVHAENCPTRLLRRCADLINRQKAEVEELQHRKAEIEEVKHGFWEKKTDGRVWWYACSVCGEDIPKGRYGHDCFPDGCPSCRAKMDIVPEEVDKQ